MKLNDQIAYLRREKGITQEELASVLGVSNQAVSKWESAQCCPDITLLPELAKYFNVSVDKLLGYENSFENSAETLSLDLREKIESLPASEDYAFTLKAAYQLHAVLFAKYMTQNGGRSLGFDPDDAVEHAGSGEWGLSCISIPEITTYMRMESVFFSSNRNFRLNNPQLREITSVLGTFSDIKNLKTLMALYNLTVSAENIYVTAEQIAEESGLSESSTVDCLEDLITDYLSEKKEKGTTLYRINGRKMYLLPLLTMLSDIG